MNTSDNAYEKWGMSFIAMKRIMDHTFNFEGPSEISSNSGKRRIISVKEYLIT